MAVPCQICDKLFSNQSSMKRHLKEVHNSDTFSVAYDDKHNYKCMEEGCNTSFIESDQLRQHLKLIHNIDDEGIELEFKCYEGNFISTYQLYHNAYIFREGQGTTIQFRIL